MENTGARLLDRILQQSLAQEGLLGLRLVGVPGRSHMRWQMAEE